MDNNKYYKRGFLNQAEGMAAFECDMHTCDSGDEYYYCNSDFSLTDCGRKVTIDLSFSDNDEYQNAYSKATTIINELYILRIEMYKAWEARQKWLEEKKVANNS